MITSIIKITKLRILLLSLLGNSLHHLLVIRSSLLQNNPGNTEIITTLYGSLQIGQNYIQEMRKVIKMYPILT